MCSGLCISNAAELVLNVGCVQLNVAIRGPFGFSDGKRTNGTLWDEMAGKNSQKIVSSHFCPN